MVYSTCKKRLILLCLYCDSFKLYYRKPWQHCTVISQLYQITQSVFYLPYWSHLRLVTRPQRHTAPPSGIYLYIATNRKKKLFSSRSSLFKTFPNVFNLIIFLKSNKRVLTFLSIIRVYKKSCNMVTSPIECVIIMIMGTNF